MLLIGNGAAANSAEVSFNPGFDYFATGVIPVAVATGDINADGKLDVVTANVGADTVSILLGNGAGGFLPKTDITTGLDPRAVAMSDLNGDGNLDLVVANTGSHNISIFLGAGNGAFGPKTDFRTSRQFQPISIAIGDFNGDGKADLAVANNQMDVEGISRVSILLGTGSGSVLPTTDLFAGYLAGNLTSIAAADFNMDGKLDLAVANPTRNVVLVFFGNGTGGFSGPSQFAVSGGAQSIAIGDLNQDGKPDIAVAGSETVSVLLGDGSGNFSDANGFSVGSGHQPHSLVVADLNADGKLDIVVANSSSDTLSVLLGDGGGGFGTGIQIPSGDNPYSVSVGDFNGDAKLDLAVANANNSAFSLHLNTTAFSPSETSFTLTVAKAGVGSGSVFSAPPGIDCGADCSEVYLMGVVVALTASPDLDSIFVGWSGACSGSGTCSVGVNTTTNVTAVFADAQPPSVPFGLAVSSISSTELRVSWNLSTDNVGVTQYKVYRNSSLLTTLSGTPPTRSYSDFGLTASTSYSYTVQACDAAGNCSEQSSPVLATTLAAGMVSHTPQLEQSWNLGGISLNATLNVAGIFGNSENSIAGITENVVSVWKWNAIEGRWAFYSPQLTGPGNASYAASKNYDLLTVINPGEGYWVNATNPITLPAQVGTSFSWTGTNFAGLPSGFNLISTVETVTPSEFNVQVSPVVPAQGVVPVDNFLSLWMWDAAAQNWYFYSPLLESAGGLAAVKSYANSKSYRHFQDYNKTLGIGAGFWVNKP